MPTYLPIGCIVIIIVSNVVFKVICKSIITPLINLSVHTFLISIAYYYQLWIITPWKLDLFNCLIIIIAFPINFVIIALFASCSWIFICIIVGVMLWSTSATKNSLGMQNSAVIGGGGSKWIYVNGLRLHSVHRAW